jgi:type IV secretion system protein VirB9
MKRVLKLKLVALVVLGGALPASAWALQTPNACGNDEHVRCARYDVNEVYRVETIAGNATLVQFEEGEVVDSKESAVGLGDARAWKVGAGGNWIMFKPVTVKPDTNLIVVTNRRRYTFKLETVKRGGVPTWTLSFDYPDTRARLALEAAKKRALADAVGRSSASASVHQNENYDMHGNTVLAPTSMWDDGRFTYFRYATSRDAPAIFRLLPDGSEALVNSHAEGDTVVVHETGAGFVLRLGDSVLGVRNNAYSPDGQFNATGSTVSNTVRLVKGADK